MNLKNKEDSTVDSNEVKLNEKTLTQEEFQEVQKTFEGQKDVKIVQTGKDEYRTKIED